MTDRLPSAPLVHCARHIIHRLTTTPQADQRHRDAKNQHQGLVFSVRNGASDKTPIASLARGSVQSGFNEVAWLAFGVVRVARPGSLQILARRKL